LVMVLLVSVCMLMFTPRTTLLLFAFTLER
jgi:hypothetical protein